MNSWSLRWRILLEAALLVIAVAVATGLFGVPGAVVIGLLAVAAAAYRARRLSSQFTRMTDGVLRTASIDRSYRINPEGPAELARMARAVNRLSNRLVAAMGEADEERARLRLILESMAEGVLLVDEDGIVEFANPTALQLMGPEGEYAPGVRLITLNNNYDLNELATLPFETESTGSAQFEIRASNRVVEAIASPIDDRDGRRKSVVILTDITEIKRTEITRREFVSNASHELRTPIAAIKASAETLQRGAAEDPEVREDFLRRILEDSERIEHMVSEMLELSRLESGQTTLNIVDIDAARFLHELTERFRPQAERAGIQIVVNVADEATMLRADAAQLEHAFSNLITNALKAVDENGKITISAQGCADGVQLAVRDNGTGIQPSHIPHIFERFYKVDSARSETGTGLGLAIARHIVEAQDGTISVESQFGSGTTFSIVLPVSESRKTGQATDDI